MNEIPSLILVWWAALFYGIGFSMILQPAGWNRWVGQGNLEPITCLGLGVLSCGMGAGLFGWVRMLTI